jgi:tRNA dimethylallyltransferase
VIVGPTATGKSTLALAVADRLERASIVSADAMAVYRGMDIGTAKPDPADRARIRHFGIDVVDPSEEFGLADFQELATGALALIDDAGETPILVGGTGLYVRAVVDEFTTPGRYPDVRAELEEHRDTAALHRRLAEVDPAAAQKMEPSNRRRIVRALEVTLGSGRPFSSFGPGVDSYPVTRFLQVGLRLDRDELDRRIDARFDAWLASGLVEEVRSLPRPLSRTAAQALGYRELLGHLDGECDLAEAVATAKARTRRFARRQERWLRRDPRIVWLDATSPDLAEIVLAQWDGSPSP